jgi:hypothetical protein
VKEVVKNGTKSLSCVAYRLTRKYFSKQELQVKNVTLFGNGGKNPKLDPSRIDFIKSHLEKLNRGPLNSQQWAKCIHFMSKSISNFRNKKKLLVNLIKLLIELRA